MAKKRPTMDQRELEEWLDVTGEAIRLWRLEGCPHELVNGRPKYDPAKVVNWRIDRAKKAAEPQDVAEATKRKAVAEARLAEIKVEVEEKTYGAVADMIKLMDDRLSVFRARALAIPSRWGPSMVGIKTIPDAIKRLEKAIHEAMAGLTDDIPRAA